MNLSVVDEAGLLGEMSRQTEAHENARAAWGELFNRHRRYLFVVVSRSYGPCLGEDGVVDLVSDTFQRAFEWAGRQPDPEQVRSQFASPDPDTTRRRVLGWLGSIAQSLFRDRFRDAADTSSKSQDYLEDWKRAQSDDQEPSVPALRTQLEAALSTLNPYEADALRISLPWYDPETSTFDVPRGEASRLADQLHTNPTTLRQRRHRALQKLQRHLQQANLLNTKAGRS